MGDTTNISYAKNRKAVVDRMIRCGEGGFVYVLGPVGRDGEQKSMKVRGGLALQDALRDVVYDLLTALSDDVQDRFDLQHRQRDGGGLAAKGSNTFLADDVIGPYLANAFRTESNAPTTPDPGQSK